MSTTDAKLAVYRHYKDIIDLQNISIYHEFDDKDDISRLVAVQRLSSFYKTIEPYLDNASEYQKQNIRMTLEERKSLCRPTQQRESVSTYFGVFIQPFILD